MKTTERHCGGKSADPALADAIPRVAAVVAQAERPLTRNDVAMRSGVTSPISVVRALAFLVDVGTVTRRDYTGKTSIGPDERRTFRVMAAWYTAAGKEGQP